MPKDARPGNQVLIHLHGGQTIDTWDETIENVEDLQDRVDIGHPHWCRIGDALVFTQAIAGLELG